MAGMAAATPSSAPSDSKESLGDKDRAQLMQVASMCPVGRTLGLSADIRTNDNVHVGPPASHDDDLSELAIPNIDPRLVCREIVRERHGVVALGVVRAEEQRDFARRCKIRQVLDCGVIGAELLE